jgi:hypothetical protein
VAVVDVRDTEVDGICEDDGMWHQTQRLVARGKTREREGGAAGGRMVLLPRTRVRCKHLQDMWDATKTRSNTLARIREDALRACLHPYPDIHCLTLISNKVT